MTQQRQRAKRRRLDDSRFASDRLPEHATEDAVDGGHRQDAQSEKESWNGFCEIESEPALFNVMLREFGVKGVKVQEVVSLDDEMLAFLNKPVYGLIFLFRWREDDPDKQEASCPEGLWFANQTAGNACASVALLNIVNNIEGIDLGEHLQHFKDFTIPFTPALRGDAINNFEFVKGIHNSFARKMDKLDSDLQLKNEANSKKPRASKNSYVDAETDAGFHFIAFMPAIGKLWKFDGLERQPHALGECSQDNWLDLVKPNILTRMADYEEDQIEFSILSLVRDPLLDAIGKLAANVKCLRIVDERLHVDGKTRPTSPERSTCEEEKNDSNNNNHKHKHKHNYSNHHNIILGPDASLALTQEEIDQTTPPVEEEKALQNCSMDELQQHRQRLSDTQQDLRAAVREEQQSHQEDENYAISRRYDYGPAVNTWVRFLARKKMIERLL